MTARLLLVNTATPAGSVALTRGETILAERLLSRQGTHSDLLLPAIRQLLVETGTAIGELDAFGVVAGPGSFTGLRVGLATVKGLARATGRPVVPLSSLQGLACQVPCQPRPVCSLLDARKQQVYAGLFQWREGHPEPLGKERVLDPEALLAELDEDVVFVGEGAAAYRTLIVRRLGGRARFAPWNCHPLRAGSFGPLAAAILEAGEALSPTAVQPVYLRPSEAEVLFARRRAALEC